jgi:hypothetical protein
VIAVAHRLCRILFAMWRDGRDFDVSRLAVERGPFARTVVRLDRRTPPLRASGRDRAPGRLANPTGTALQREQ